MNNASGLSIIIPHKNIPVLLQRCLDSIPRRSGIQIIVVDDNSDPRIVDFSCFPGLQDPQVEVIFTKDGKGAGYARNVGLDRAKGKWLLFADADDFFVAGAFDWIFAEADTLYEIVYFKTVSCYSDTYEPSDRGEKFNLLVDDFIAQKKDAENMLRYNYSVPWGKMIRREFVKRNNIRFDEVPASNDIMFSNLTAYYATSVNAREESIYCVTIRRGSLVNSLNSEHLRSRYIVALRANEFLRNHGLGRYQGTIPLYYFLCSVKYGIQFFLSCLKLAVHYRMNPFWGIHKWLFKYIAMRKNSGTK